MWDIVGSCRHYGELEVLHAGGHCGSLDSTVKSWEAPWRLRALRWPGVTVRHCGRLGDTMGAERHCQSLRDLQLASGPREERQQTGSRPQPDG